MEESSYLTISEVEDPLGRSFHVSTMDAGKFFEPHFWSRLEKFLNRFHIYVSPAQEYNEGHIPKHILARIENDNEKDATRAHDNLRRLISKGYVMGP